LSQFANDFVAMQRQNKTKELDAGFAVIERLYVEGDKEVQETVTWCFLEDFVFETNTCQIDPKAFAPYVRPATRMHWEEMKRYWPIEAFVGQPERGSA